ncbi:ABC transporter permease subunit, partial [Rickettsiales bacterium]|nr:ABC transporter permease subunit [Rickettsiales bacterium]
ISVATLSLFLSLIIAIPISIIGCQSLSKSILFDGKINNTSLICRYLLRSNLVFLRSLPELILAIIFIRIFGLGVTAAVFAIVFTYVGFMSKVFIEIIDSSSTHPYKNLIYNGNGKFKAFFYGILPQCSNELISYTLFRWECALRTSIILGVVGGGGIGQQLDFSIKMMALNEVSTIILSLVLLVYISDILSYWIRRVFCK